MHPAAGPWPHALARNEAMRFAEALVPGAAALGLAATFFLRGGASLRGRSLGEGIARKG